MSIKNLLFTSIVLILSFGALAEDESKFKDFQCNVMNAEYVMRYKHRAGDRSNMVNKL